MLVTVSSHTWSLAKAHVLQGNFHALIMFTDDEMPQVTEAVHRMVHRAIALDGTCTGEHGVGLGKKKFLVEELGEGTVELMRTVKKAIDPDNLFNPGKVGLPIIPSAALKLISIG